MNNLFGTSLRDLAKDFNGFVREVVEELGTVRDDQTQDIDDYTDNSQDDEEDAIERELKHQLLELSDDDDDNNIASNIRSNNTQNDQKDDKDKQSINDHDDNQQNNDNDNDNQINQADIELISKDLYNELNSKYLSLKQNYRKSMLVVEKLQIHNKALKETLNEQMIIREKQSEKINKFITINQDLENQLNVQNTIASNDKISIFENYSPSKSKSKSKMVVKSVVLNDDQNELIKLRETLKKASRNMKELKKRYKKCKQDMNNKNDEFEKLKSQYVTYKISQIKKINIFNNGLNKELLFILNNTKNTNNIDNINPLQIEMIRIINACIKTILWFIADASNDGKSDKNIIDISKIKTIKNSLISLRDVICEFIATIQQWMKLLNGAIDRDDIKNNKKKSDDFQDID